jgi:hypothetical protein
MWVAFGLWGMVITVVVLALIAGEVEFPIADDMRAHRAFAL